MKTWIKNNKGLFVAILITVINLLFLILFLILRSIPGVPSSYTNTIIRVFNPILNAISSIFPISILEFLFISFIALVITLLVLTIRYFVKKKPKKGIRNSLMIISSVLILINGFMFNQGMAYTKPHVDLKLYSNRVPQNQYKEIINYYIDDLNDCASKLEFDEKGEVINNYSVRILGEKINDIYDALKLDFLLPHRVTVKPLTFSHLFSEFSITGITVNQIGEVNINYLCPNSELAFTIAHEIAHNKGITSEQDCNDIAAYVLLQSNDPFLKYNGYYVTYSSLLMLGNYTGNKGDYKELVSKIDDKVKKNYNYTNKFWSEYSHLSKFADWINNLFLKSNGESEGTSSYIDKPVVDDEGKDIQTYSIYQRIFFELYFRNK